MHAFLFVFKHDDITLYERIMGNTMALAYAAFEREWPNCRIIHIQVVG